jgi:hypothetical protein
MHEMAGSESWWGCGRQAGGGSSRGVGEGRGRGSAWPHRSRKPSNRSRKHSTAGQRFFAVEALPRRSENHVGVRRSRGRMDRPWALSALGFYMASACDAVDGSPPREQGELRRMNGRRAMGQVVVVGLDIAKSVFRCTALIATVRW